MAPETQQPTRRLMRRSSSRKSNIVMECKVFLGSSRTLNLLSSLPTRPAPWEYVLKKALVLWDALENTEPHEDIAVHQATIQAIWEMVCVLVKANYYLQNHYPLVRLRTETFEEYALHAAVGLTGVRSVSLLPVLERLLRLHASQLQVKEPVHGRLPLHVAAATPYHADRYEILVGLVGAYPRAAIEKDSQGIFPLHLACQAKYPWKHGLEVLYRVAAHIGELTCPCCPPELLAQQDCYDRSLDTVYALVQTDMTLLS